ncbi:protein FAM81B isoform X2 [Pleurodeles waltl]|uniref:protein FAM81B isoform X2 n=1 Tax=Pleurodeles waltl TaxID=8319 RepID=UPI003709A631
MLSCSRGQSFLPAIPGVQAHFLEDRVSNQERTTAILLDQAFRLKDELVVSLRNSRGSYQGEVMAHRLLENHIHTITSIVSQLSRDIEALEEQIRTRDGVSTCTSFAVQTLDHKHINGIGDLRGRVARCDASISKLSGDLTITRQEMKQQEKEVHSLRVALEVHAKESDMKVMQLLGKMETSISEQSSKAKTAHGEQIHELQLLDYKLANVLTELRGQIQSQRKWTESQLQRSEQDQMRYADQLLSTTKEKMNAAEKKLDEQMHLFRVRLESSDDVQRLEAELNGVKQTQEKIHGRIKRIENELWDELEEIKNEYRAGFNSIQDSIASLQQIQETKVKLETKKFQKDIKQIRRKITEIKDF